MIVTAIQRRRGPAARVSVHLDGQRRVDLLHATVERLGWRPGAVVDETELQAILAADARRTAFETAARLVARRPHGERELRRKLARRGMSGDLIDEAIAWIAAAGAIDDAAFARGFAETRNRTSPRGRRTIVAELRARGVDRATAVQAAADVPERDAAYRFARRRARSLAGDDYRAFRDRLGPQLQRRGFEWDVARETVDRVWCELHPED